MLLSKMNDWTTASYCGSKRLETLSCAYTSGIGAFYFRDISGERLIEHLGYDDADTLLIPGDSRPPIPVILGHPC